MPKYANGSRWPARLRFGMSHTHGRMHQVVNPAAVTTGDLVETVKDALWTRTPLTPVTPPEGLTPDKEIDWVLHTGLQPNTN